jgi:hypothetical protein
LEYFFIGINDTLGVQFITLFFCNFKDVLPFSLYFFFEYFGKPIKTTPISSAQSASTNLTDIFYQSMYIPFVIRFLCYIRVELLKYSCFLYTSISEMSRYHLGLEPLEIDK